MKNVKFALGSIGSDRDGFAVLSEFAADAVSVQDAEVIIDFSRAGWFEGNMAAPLGAIVASIMSNRNTVKLTNLPSRLQHGLSKNGFMSLFGLPVPTDSYRMHIPFRRFSLVQDDNAFVQYIEEFFRGRGMPEMTPQLRRKTLEGIYEIFANATAYSGSTIGVFSCGQYFPRRNKLDFSICDLGVGIRKHIYDAIGLNLKASDAINWAMQEGNTTKRGPVPGGLGLKILLEFIEINGGRLQIISDRGYWESNSGIPSKFEMHKAFPGTVVNIEVNAGGHSVRRAREYLAFRSHAATFDDD